MNLENHFIELSKVRKPKFLIKTQTLNPVTTIQDIKFLRNDTTTVLCKATPY